MTTTEVTPFTVVPARVSRNTRVSGSLRRLTFCGEDLRWVADNGYDQRIKLLLPVEGAEDSAAGLAGLDAVPRHGDWYTQWRTMPSRDRPVMRTYTVRNVRPDLGELDIDLVDHGDIGPASRFARQARPGDRALLVVPDARYDGTHGGVEFRHDLAGHVEQLIVGDESALPAVCGILERLPSRASGLVCLEVGSDTDLTDVGCPPGMTLRWCLRAERRGMLQRAEVDGWLRARPNSPEAPELSAWIAGESAVVRDLRHLLVREHHVPRSAVTFMGYWREGHAEC